MSATINTTQEQNNTTPNRIEQNDSTNEQQSTVQSDDSRIKNTSEAIFPSSTCVLIIIFGSGFITIGIICAIIIPFWLLSVKDSKNNNNNNNNNNTQLVAGRNYRNISDDIFQYRIEEFNTGIIDGYSNDDELKHDIWNAAMSYMHKEYNSTIQSATPPEELLFNRRLYTTTQEEEVVNEGNTVVYDTNYVYCAFGKYLVIWKVKTGVIVKIMDMYQQSQRDNDMPELKIVSMLLVNERLIVAANLIRTDTGTILSDFGSLNVRIYDTITLVEQSLPSDTASNDLTGLFRSMYVVNGVLYIISQSTIDLEGHLRLPSLGKNETIDKYNNRIMKRVRQICHNFTTKLLQDLQQLELTTNLLRINTWEAYHSTNTNTHSPINSLLDCLTIIYSIDMTAGMTESELVQTQVGFFGSDFPPPVRTSYDMIVLTMRVQDMNVNDNSTYPSEVIVAYDLVEMSAKPRLVGRLNRSTIEFFTIVGDTLHVTTKFDEFSTENTSSPLVRENCVVTIKIPSSTSSSSSDDPIQMIEQSRVQLGVSSSDFIYSTHFLHNVTIVSTVSFDESTGHLYVVDMSNPNNVSIMTVLDNNGKTHTISSLDSDSPRVFEIGGQQQIATDTDTDTNAGSVYFSIFDVTNTSQMNNRSQTLVDAAPYYSVDVQTNDDSSRNKLYSDGYVFLPVYLKSYNDTSTSRDGDATMMFRIDKESGSIIEKKECRIFHQIDDTIGTSSDSDCIYEGGYLYSGSIAFDDQVMTMKGDKVIMTNLTSCQLMWNFTISIRYKCDT